MTTSSSQTCSACARPLTPHERFSGGVCADWRCREKLLRDALLAHRYDAARALGVEPAEAYPIVVVPWRTGKVVPLPEERWREFGQFLAGLLAATLRPPPASEPEARSPNRDEVRGEPDRLLAAVCGVCAGFCCHYGGARHAFLDAEAMAAFRAVHPEMRDAAVIDAYLDRLPPESREGSCVYQAAQGCALPRAMRARICNAYECGGLREARQAGASVCVVVRHDHRIVRSAFVDASGIRPYVSASTRSSSSP